MRFKCTVCGDTALSLVKYCIHMKYHSSLQHFKCCVANCGVVCSSMRKWKTHYYNSHARIKNNPNQLLCTNLCCTIPTCRQLLSDGKALISHLRMHIDNGIKIMCPVPGCSLQFSVKGSFSFHLSRQHYSKLKRTIVHDECVELPDSVENLELPESVENVNLPTAMSHSSTASSTGVAATTMMLDESNIVGNSLDGKQEKAKKTNG